MTTDISQRPEIAALRIEEGHWEGDTVVGKKAGKEAVVLTLLEKKTQNYIAIKIPGKDADSALNFGSLIADDLKGILRDIRNEHRPDTMTADETSLAATVQGQLQDEMNFEGRSEEKQIRSFLATFGIDYDKLTKEQLVSLIEVLKLSKYLKSPISQRGKARPQLPHGKGKKKRK